MDGVLLHPDKALALVLQAAPEPRFETVALADALGRVLARELASTVDHPPFDKSAMDGFAYDPRHPADLYKVSSVIAAGAPSDRKIGQGECARIMTGSPLPPGTAAVQRVESAGADSSGVELVRFTGLEPVPNVILRGENLRSGETLMSPRLLAPQDIGILASSGYASVEVSARPRVAVLSTGDEVCEAGGPLRKAAIYDSNGPQLAAQAKAAGCEAVSYGIVRDDAGALEQALARALDECDVVIVSGGVSMGDFDFVPKSLAALGVERVFHKVAMRPGKPTWFGKRGSKAVFGLPGNPVSTFVNFEFLVRPHLLRRMGLTYEPRIVSAALAVPLARSGGDRVEFLPARLERSPGGGQELVRPIDYKGSSMLNALANADCLVRMEIGVVRLEAGETVDARLVRP
jgi:molybdopterin molybdotransferase